MGVVENLRQKRRLGIGLALLLFGVAAIAYQLFTASPNVSSIREAYYTVDDGQSLFVESENKLAPFDHQGKEAVRAHVFEIEGKRVVKYLERYSGDAHHILMEVKEAVRTAKPGDKPPAALALVDSAQRNGREVKKPGDPKWVNINSPAGAALTHIRTTGSSVNATEVDP